MEKPWLPIRPPIACPDCPGAMHLQHMPENWGGGSGNPFFYRCEKAPACGGLLSAHPNGDPVGEAVPKDIRQARRHCHAKFDPLWLEAYRIYTVVEQEGPERAKALAIIRRTARKRAYAFLAERLGLTVAACHIGMITDIVTLRRFYAAARDTNPTEIRDWAKARRAAQEAA